jgi:hypothetical protein
MNLVMRGILPDNIAVRNGDTLEDDWPYFDEDDPHGTYAPLYVDAVVSNPPYSQAWEPADKDADPRYSRFGLAPKTKADFAFLLHDLFHLKPNGIMTIVLPHGVLFRGGYSERRGGQTRLLARRRRGVRPRIVGENQSHSRARGHPVADKDVHLRRHGCRGDTAFGGRRPRRDAVRTRAESALSPSCVGKISDFDAVLSLARAFLCSC